MTEGSGARKHCAATTVAGGPCPVSPRRGSEFCYQHDPAVQEHRDLSRKLGGLKAGQVVPVANKRYATVESLHDLADETINQLRAHRIAPAHATAVVRLIEAKLSLAGGEAVSRLLVRMREAKSPRAALEAVRKATAVEEP